MRNHSSNQFPEVHFILSIHLILYWQELHAHEISTRQLQCTLLLCFVIRMAFSASRIMKLSKYTMTKCGHPIPTTNTNAQNINKIIHFNQMQEMKISKEALSMWMT